LASELQSFQLPVSQCLPKDVFGAGRLCSHGTGKYSMSWWYDLAHITIMACIFAKASPNPVGPKRSPLLK
jgi:hypothetical protein